MFNNWLSDIETAWNFTEFYGRKTPSMAGFKANIKNDVGELGYEKRCTSRALRAELRSIPLINMILSLRSLDQSVTLELVEMTIWGLI